MNSQYAWYKVKLGYFILLATIHTSHIFNTTQTESCFQSFYDYDAIGTCFNLTTTDLEPEPETYNHRDRQLLICEPLHCEGFYSTYIKYDLWDRQLTYKL